MAIHNAVFDWSRSLPAYEGSRFQILLREPNRLVAVGFASLGQPAPSITFAGSVW
jgi:hypothetical protein